VLLAASSYDGRRDSGLTDMLTVDGVWKTFRGVAAVRALTLQAEPGNVVGLLGPNGSGKSTTVRMIVGLLRPTRGCIRWRGTDIHQQLLAYQKIVGYIPEEPRLYAYLSAVEYLELVGGLRGIPREALARRIDRYLELFALDTDRHAPLSAFSKGMRQKVLVAAALIHDPELILLDEPDSGLDVAATLALRSLIATLAERGRTIIYSSHVLDAVERVCRDDIILRHGSAIASTSVTRLRELTETATLEDAFTTVAVDQDVAALGRELADVSSR
jgi:ABC-2 type transport system ATP-binding protein